MRAKGFVHRRPWAVLAAGAAIQLLTGVPSAWGAFQKGVCEGYRLREEDAALILSVVVCFFGIGCVLGGLLQDRAGPRAAGLAGAALLAGGFLAAGWWVPEGSPGLFYVCFSAPVGLGCAFLYPAVMSCAQKWYADKKGLATGVIGCAAGLSGAALTALARGFSAWGGVRASFWGAGLVMGGVCGTAALFLHDPDESARPAAPGARQYTAREMARTRQFWQLAASLFFAAPTVLLFSPVIVELAAQRGLAQGAALSCVWLGAVSAAAGRLSMPWLSDRIGRRAADMLLFAALAALSAAFAFARGWWMLGVYCALTFCYAGQAAVLPSAVNDLFGQKNAGVNYGLVALGMSAGSLAFPLAARALGLQAGRHWVAVLAAAAGFCCVRRLRPTQGEKL